MIYYIVFFISIILFHKAVSYKEARYSAKYILISILIPVLLAALRSDQIGTDVTYYLIKLHRDALSTNGLWTYIAFKSNFEPLFLILIYINAKITGSIYVLQGIIQLLIMCPIYWVTWKLRNRINPEMALVVYYLIIFAENLNIMRQSIAMSIVLLTTFLFYEKKKVRAIVFLLIGIGFHRTAIIGIVFCILCYMIRASLNKLYICGVVAISLFVALFSKNIIHYISTHISILPERYFSDYYLNSGRTDLAMAEVLLYIINLMLLLVTVDREDDFEKMLLIISTMAAIGVFAIVGMNIAARIIKYFKVFLIFSLPISERMITEKNYSKTIYNSLMIAICLIYWIYNYVILGYGEIYPYHFANIRY